MDVDSRELLYSRVARSELVKHGSINLWDEQLHPQPKGSNRNPVKLSAHISHHQLVLSEQELLGPFREKASELTPGDCLRMEFYRNQACSWRQCLSLTQFISTVMESKMEQQNRSRKMQSVVKHETSRNWINVRGFFFMRKRNVFFWGKHSHNVWDTVVMHFLIRCSANSINIMLIGNVNLTYLT